MIVILPFQRRLDGVSELLAGFPLRGDEPNIWDFELAAVVHAKAFRFIVAIFNDTETDVIVRAKTFFVVQHRH